ncbi:hypothetical protein D8674_008256 [Pyrus ussuriensis x Pyrus communis]|uniref:Uncharacterized protein n=1 Tax=Pyrus ussuriensis x Pyrus communis TaxID=2448454 RepID=A0A5N5HV79_9ROSA|nr:hypothetical protein D8674_008256 [Pyrus ussuriensis x Pyrus communis]
MMSKTTISINLVWHLISPLFSFKGYVSSKQVAYLCSQFGGKPSGLGNMMEMSKKPMIGSLGKFSSLDVGLEEEATNALVLQEATIEVARQETSSSYVLEDAENISEMFSESKTKARPKL